MKTLERVVLLFLLVVMGTLLTVSQTQAAASCHKIKAKGFGQDLGNNTSVTEIKGGGLLQGTSEGRFEIISFSEPIALIKGTMVFTTNKGTLTVAITATFDVSSGEFRASGPVTGGTDKLAGATGALVFEGVEDLSDGSFVEDITGEICVDLAP